MLYQCTSKAHFSQSQSVLSMHTIPFQKNLLPGRLAVSVVEPLSLAHGVIPGGPGIQSHSGLPAWIPLLSPPVSLHLCLCLCVSLCESLTNT